MKTFWIVSGLLLVWALIGDAAYLTQTTADLEELAKTDPVAAQAFSTMPTWAWSAYAIAVWCGTLGAISLLLRRRWAFALYVISLIGVMAQFSWSLLGTPLIQQKGPGVVIFPAIIFIIGAFAVWWSQRQIDAGVLR